MVKPTESRTSGGHPADRIALSRAQLLMWSGQRLRPTVPLYNQAFVFTISGPLDTARLDRAFAALVAQSDALRTVMVEIDGRPWQDILPVEGLPDSFRIEHLDVSASDDPDQAAAAITTERSQRDFDLAARLFDAVSIRTGVDRWCLYLCQHHVVTDAWSMAVLFRRLAELYRDPDAHVPPLPAYREYLTLEAERREAPDAAAVEHWRALADKHPVSLYGRKPTGSTASRRIELEVDAERATALRRLARSREAGALTEELGLFHIFATWICAFQFRVSGETSVTLGALAHNRSHPSLRQTPGLLTEAFPMAIDIEADDSFVDLLARVREATYGFLRHAAPGASTAKQNQSFVTILNLIRADFGDFAGAPVDATWLHPGHHDAEHSLRVHVHDFGVSGAMRIELDLHDELAEAVGHDRLIGHLSTLLDALIDDWHQSIERVPMLSSAEIARLTSGDRQGA
ncbi:MAG: condensation domain-containing protein, partial [Acidobacteriota bacterium]